MACFIVPGTVGVITTALRKKVPKKWHVNWLNTMLWGGTIALAVEHVAHQEVVPFPPFLTAMGNPADIPIMLHEMATIGGAMTLCIVFAWFVMVAIASTMEEKAKVAIRHEV
ncbi:MAG: hypothetical protein KKE04_00830 [Candidatus Thermoplasmatota archaeon]|nr:hypothetical protein [Candidatus Thermoplasmatota archaeon]